MFGYRNITKIVSLNSLFKIIRASNIQLVVFLAV